MTEIKNTSVIDFSDISDEQMNEMIDGTLTEFDEGDLVDGTVVKLEHDEVLVDIGFKSEGVIPARELSIRKDANPADIVALGDPIEALVLQKEDKDGRLVLSKKRAEYERAWNRIEEKFNSGENVEGEVIEVVKGGLILDIGLRGFLPASLVDLRRVKDLTSYMGTRIEARVIEMDRNRNNVVLSRRVLLEEGRKNERAEILSKLSKGMRLKGNVSSIVDFGAFVDLGGIDGLVHISELSWNHVNHPSEVVKVGDEVEVEVLDVDLQRERISIPGVPYTGWVADGIDKYEAWERCREDKEYERGLLLRMRGFLHYQPVPCRCHLEYQRSPVRRIYVGYISFSRQRRRIFPSVLDAQAAPVAKGWNPENFRIVEEDTQNLKSQKQ